MRANTWWIGLVAGGVLAAGVSGCASQANRAPRELQSAPPMEYPLLRGIPVPRGYRVLEDRSLARETSTYRVARYEFVGSDSPAAVHAFFLKQMPEAGFVLVQRREEDGVHQLRFQSPDEECAIRIGRRSMQTYFVIDVGPLPKTDGLPGARQRAPRSR